jgi:hypothetical protein
MGFFLTPCHNFSYKNRAVRIRKGNLCEAWFIMENMYSVHKINPVGVG